MLDRNYQDVRNILRRRYLTWRNTGNFVVVGLPSMDAVYPSNVHLEALQLRNVTTSKTSIVLIAMVDANNRFVWGSCGFPGNSHNAIIFQSTQLYSDIKESNFIPQISKAVSGVHVPSIVLGDSAFPLLPWLMKPYANAAPTPEQYYFNLQTESGMNDHRRGIWVVKGQMAYTVEKM